MKFVLKFLVVIVAFSFVSVHCTMAQTTYTVQGGKSQKKIRVSKKLQEMKDALSLTDEQVAKIQTLTKESREQGKSANAEITDPKAKRAASKERSKSLESNITSVFTPEQAKKYEQWKIDQKEERKQKREAKKEQK